MWKICCVAVLGEDVSLPCLSQPQIYGRFIQWRGKRGNGKVWKKVWKADSECCQLDRIQIAWQMSVWACLWGIVLIVLSKVGRPAHCGWCHSLAGSLDCISREKELNSGTGSSLSLSWVQMQCGQPAFCSCRHAFPACFYVFPTIMDWIPLEQQVKINLFHLNLFL